MDELPGVKEALSRLPQAVIDERYFRLKRAMQVSGKYSVLPEGQWTTEDQVRDGVLLQTYLKKKKERWGEAIPPPFPSFLVFLLPLVFDGDSF